MYSGLLPKGFTESDLSSDAEEVGQCEEEQGNKSNSCTENVRGIAGQSTLTAVEVDSSQTPADPQQDKEPPTDILPGISQEMWQKFKELQKKKDELQTCQKVPRRRRKRKHKKGTSNEVTTKEGEHRGGLGKQWDGLQQYFGVNDRFQPPASSTADLQSGLEKRMELAIAEGDFAGAEEMSDSLATRELAVKITQAADCRDYVQHKQEEEASRAAQKRKAVAWGFEAKKRWETKSNMGYM
ncbi:protein FAM204A [Gadus chalcogrammus]|uniref:protein FAM204A n=1 Tax=Gadus chalcogrammus TaxID=1042646 RepID=UPI0024C4AF00|nr:protein FAM204A [Gadus chalcogrammus]XP_056465364.1 protein FAM204A [Gadus chalcogrammus]